jgi:GNAT superfamily N-acetyltransferase
MVLAVEGPRALRPEELGSLVGLANRVFRSEGGGDMGAEFSYFLNEANAPHLRVFVEGGAVVAHCGWRESEALLFGCALSVGGIGAVCTAPEQRGKGLGTRLLLDTVADMRASGVDLALISGGRGLYTRNAAVKWGPGREYLYEPASAGDWRSDVELSSAAPPDAACLAALYRSEPIRYRRAPREWAEILAGRWCMNRPTKLLAVRRGGELVAYAAAREPGSAESDPRGTILGEFAGCRAALVAALPRIAEISGCQRLLLPAGSWDLTLRAEMAARGIDPAPEAATSGTVKLVNFPRLMEKLLPLLVERAGLRASGLSFSQTDAGLAVSLGGERLDLGEADACAMVFGRRDGRERELLEGRGELGRLLAAALPLELPWYGYNYV